MLLIGQISFDVYIQQQQNGSYGINAMGSFHYLLGREMLVLKREGMKSLHTAATMPCREPTAAARTYWNSFIG